jgi:hypothetical protein
MTASKFTPERRAVILEALREGCSRRTASGLAGIEHAQLYRWVKRGEETGAPDTYREFAQAVICAEAVVSGKAVTILNRAMDNEPKWAAWWLERRDPEFAPPRARMEVAPEQTRVVVLTLDDGRSVRPLPSSTVTVGDDESNEESASG